MFNTTRALGVTYKGISLEILAKEAGTGYSNTVKAYPAVVEAKVQMLKLKLQRDTKPHPSNRDKNDIKDIMTIGYHTKKGTRYLSIHAHEDGTWKEFLSRAGKHGSASQQTEN
ncbi:uncharacterized protein BO80DRAFT_431477 [Aspergillus ibericus CBS 121593]|uniref:Uncharacterized protein n=1 Tax=Aspergillus ibericus CBS 121593 TaxID=1448316 RepID=A0A395HAF0_9EURO|nr:hypothetical protein BO80DRAFT_431477 [Aspergillus ibericus CBS 121593]RAL04887.1 hypothetical protein BO80DRAFT_431477 [Aspergillus ibericus CBS 121593]